MTNINPKLIGAMTSVVMLGSMAGAQSAMTATRGSPVRRIATCAARMHHPMTLRDAVACAPGARVATRSTRFHAGTYIVKGHRGYEIVSVTSRPTRPPMAGGPSGRVAHTASAFSCAFRQMSIIDGGGIVEWLGANFCWNQSTAMTYGDVQSNCTPWLPGYICQYRQTGRGGNYTAVAMVWGKYYNTYLGLFTGGELLGLGVQANGNVQTITRDI